MLVACLLTTGLARGALAGANQYEDGALATLHARTPGTTAQAEIPSSGGNVELSGNGYVLGSPTTSPAGPIYVHIGSSTGEVVATAAPATSFNHWIVYIGAAAVATAAAGGVVVLVATQNDEQGQPVSGGPGRANVTSQTEPGSTSTTSTTQPPTGLDSCPVDDETDWEEFDNPAPNRPSSRTLGRNMIAAGRPPPDSATYPSSGHRAHHIIAGTAIAHQGIRGELGSDRFNMDINDADNGVWLPKDYHQCMHTGLMYENVRAAVQDWYNNNMPNADGREGLRALLQDMGREMLAETFPIR